MRSALTKIYSLNLIPNQVEPKFSTYRQAREACSVACAIILLQAGAKITDKVREEVHKDSFFAKGVKRTRMLRVFEAFEKGLKIDWGKHWKVILLPPSLEFSHAC